MSANTLFLRLEGPMQAWGDHQSKFLVRRTAEAPTKSGVIGMICAALEISRSIAPAKWFPKLPTLRMGVRIDAPGVRWWDYHTVGAGMQMRIAEAQGKTKPGAMITRREWLCDASFLVALQGDSSFIEEIAIAIRKPKWLVYLGRKSCPPSRPLLEHPAGKFDDLLSAFASVPWRRRLKSDPAPQTVDALLDWQPTVDQPEAPDGTEIWYDVPRTFEPPGHNPRFVIRRSLRVSENGELSIAPNPAQSATPRPLRPRADYSNTEYKKRRLQRLESDHRLCVFCKAPATTVQHVTYRRAGGDETQDDLRSLCRLCHDAVTMIEYGLGMGLDRINPEEPRWQDEILRTRNQILEFRSEEKRRRALRTAPEKVRKEILEEDV